MLSHIHKKNRYEMNKKYWRKTKVAKQGSLNSYAVTWYDLPIISHPHR